MRNKKIIFIFSIIPILLISLLLINYEKSTTKEVYLNEDSIKTSSSPIGIYIEQDNGTYKYSGTYPEKGSGFTLDTTQSICDGNTTISWDSKNWNIIIKNINQEDLKCYLYFRKETASEKLLMYKNIEEGEKEGFNQVEIANHSDTLYTDIDDFGTTYYFRGKVNSNWVKFGKTGTDTNGKDIYWRIIRINGDGTIRMMYSGEGSAATSDGGYTTNGAAALINKDTSIKYYSSNNRAEYVGFQFKTESIHGYGTGTDVTKSNVLTQLNTWFENNLSDEFASENGKIDKNVGFCNDRRNSTTKTTAWGSENDNGGTGTTTTYYGAHLRLIPKGSYPSPTNKSKPTFNCKDIDNDYFTYTGATQKTTATKGQTSGTKSLTYPVGLITADEVTFAGGLYDKNNSDYYLNNQSNGYYWTMSPSYFISSSGARVFCVVSNGNLGLNIVNFTYGIRPVINLKADITFAPEGDGSSTNPYVA